MERKIFRSEIKEYDKKDLSVVHFISTELPDRGGDILYADGMVMTGRPVVLFQHGYGSAGSEPIAKPIWIKKGEFKNRKGIQAKTQFYPDDLGKRLWEKTTKGYLPNWSIGWIPLRHEIKTNSQGVEMRHVYEWELLEYSLVAVPMQPDAQTLENQAMSQMAFKIMPVGGLSKRPRTVTVNRPKPTKLEIPDDLVKKIVRQTAHEEIERLKGRVK
jgi:Fe-S cluster biosynthesis and repair protein YggX